MFCTATFNCGNHAITCTILQVFTCLTADASNKSVRNGETEGWARKEEMFSSSRSIKGKGKCKYLLMFSH